MKIVQVFQLLAVGAYVGDVSYRNFSVFQLLLLGRPQSPHTLVFVARLWQATYWLVQVLRHYLPMLCSNCIVPGARKKGA